MSKVRQIQQLLSDKGFNPGPIDGLLGSKTENAIIAALSKQVLFLSDDSPFWLRVAFSYLGLSEIKGELHNNTIVGFWKSIKANFRDDETPWCSAFVCGVLEQCQIRSSRSGLARSFNDWGEELAEPCIGCIVVFWRGSPEGYSGHVGFVAGRDKQGRLMVLGGNQQDSVSIQPFDSERILSFRWPSHFEKPGLSGFSNLPFVDLNAELSINEQ